MGRTLTCVCNDLEEINEFFSISEFERFQVYLKGLVDEGELMEVPVKERFAGFFEQWYQCRTCAGIWRLVHPDFPFKGIWRTVK